jgi:hypothetical protein
MKKIICFWIMALTFSLVNGQDEEKSEPATWNFGADANFYFFKDDFIILPVFRADRKALHLEARYNYEDIETFSVWAGYNFIGGAGEDFEYTFTPMIGGVFGRTGGVGTGIEITLSYKGFELYSEGEYLFDSEAVENNFYYNWTDLTYSPKDWLWFGLSAQRTRLYDTDLEIQRGLLVGGGFKNWELTGYLYNIGFDDPFVLLTLSASF